MDQITVVNRFRDVNPDGNHQYADVKSPGGPFFGTQIKAYTYGRQPPQMCDFFLSKKSHRTQMYKLLVTTWLLQTYKKLKYNEVKHIKANKINFEGSSAILNNSLKQKEPPLDEKGAKSLMFEGDSFAIGSKSGGDSFP